MFSAISRRFILITSLLAVLVVAGCAGREPEQRRAFILFLQTRVLGDTGATVPVMTARDREEFGPFADSYQVLFDFSRTLNDATNAYNDASNLLQNDFNSMKALQDNWQKLSALRQRLLQTGRRLASDYEKVQGIHSALNQPEDVRVVYDQAFAVLVTSPGDAFRRILVPWDKTLQASEDLGRFLSDNAGQLRITGMTIQLQDTALQPEWKRLQEKYQFEVQGLTPLIQALAATLAASPNRVDKNQSQDARTPAADNRRQDLPPDPGPISPVR
ncbi:MAG: DUF3053 domain-containing protein [Alphaproteobacteria bacterium]|nr:DUF3053 domain-containing protein [Alphaproteobacteria bacterium]